MRINLRRYSMPRNIRRGLCACACVLLGLALAAPVFAQDSDDPREGFALGLGIEGNGYNNGDGTSGVLGLGFSLTGEYRFNIETLIPILSTGLRLGGFTNLNGLLTLEPLAFLRLSFRSGLLGRSWGMVHIFIEGNFGAALLRYEGEGDLSPSLSGGASAGARIFLGNNWYIEPYIRGGYPVFVGGGLLGGYAFNQ